MLKSAFQITKYYVRYPKRQTRQPHIKRTRKITEVNVAETLKRSTTCSLDDVIKIKKDLPLK
jgi:hypothetical protein